MARNRIIYASQSVWANGEVLYRVQSLGTTTTFTSEDVFELGHLDIIDVVDDVPKVAVTLNTNDFGDVKTLAILAQVPPIKKDMGATATSTTGNLVSGSNYLHGVCLADFAVSCGNLPGVTIWAPVQSECDLGTLANNIDQTLFLDKVFVNSIEFGYKTGASATENFGAETDNKMWLLNGGAFVNFIEATVSGTDITNTYIDMVANGFDATSVIPTLSTGELAFLRKSKVGASSVTWYDVSTDTMTNVAVVAGSAQAATTFVYDSSTDRLYMPSGSMPAAGDRIQIIFAADKYSLPMNTYFTPLTGTANSDVGALRQGQVEVSIIDGANTSAVWRLTGCTITADLKREPLMELGHLSPYDRPLTVPIPITLKVDSTAGDLENWAMFAGKSSEYGAFSLDNISLTDLMNKSDLILMIKVFEQTDEEAGGGTGASRKVATDGVVGDYYFNDGVKSAVPYALGDTEHALKTIVVKHLKFTDEGMTLDMKANATQTFGFRSTNDLYVVKGDLTPALAASLARNSS